MSKKELRSARSSFAIYLKWGTHKDRAIAKHARKQFETAKNALDQAIKAK